jgi:hypothetical protein
LIASIHSRFRCPFRACVGQGEIIGKLFVVLTHPIHIGNKKSEESIHPTLDVPIVIILTCREAFGMNLDHLECGGVGHLAHLSGNLQQFLPIKRIDSGQSLTAKSN